MANPSETKDRIRELQTAAKTIEAANDEIVKSIEGKGSETEPFLLTEEQRATFKSNTDKLGEIRAEIELLQPHDEFKQWRDAPAGTPVTIEADALKEIFGVKDLGNKSLGQLFCESEPFKSFKASGVSKMDAPFVLEGVDLTHYSKFGRKAVYTDLPDGTPGAFGTVQRDPFVTRPQRRFRVRDLLNVVRTTARVIEYFIVSGYTNAASAVPERNAGNTSFAYKPESALTFTGAQTTVRTIAHWEPAHRDVLDDEPVLQDIIETELLYGLQLHEDYQILNGTGTGQDLLGLLNTPGRQSYNRGDTDATENTIDAVRRAITLVLLADYEATGVVLNPLDWEEMELAKDDNGQYLLAVSIAMGAEQRIWRLPVVDTAAITENTGLVGAFSLAATLYDRMEATIRIADQHADFFVQNAVAILAEERLGLACKRPEAFVEVGLTAAGP